MAAERFGVGADIRQARTLPADFYRSQAIYDELNERVLAPSWQFVGHEREVAAKGMALPLELLAGSLNEPLVLSRDHAGELRCMSNVCTHRANLVVTKPGICKKLRCRYHGRSFQHDGSFDFMPEFEGAEGFPCATDDLPQVPMGNLEGLLFASLKPAYEFESMLGDLRQRLAHLPIKDFRLDAAHSEEYEVEAHWALYVDNFLEGFHIPYVHPSLADVLDYKSYDVELFERANLQLGLAKAGEPIFDDAPGTQDAGKRVGAYYYWLYPNTMLNFYPWGLSVNVVRPMGLAHTKVSFYSYVWKPERLGEGAGGALELVQGEDEEVVNSVQRGINSRLYQRGRFSPKRESCVHQFQRLLQTDLAT
jgi:choline monooxygenase